MADKKEKVVSADVKSALAVAEWLLKAAIFIIIIVSVSRWFREKRVVFPKPYTPTHGTNVSMHTVRLPIIQTEWIEQEIPANCTYLQFDILYAAVVYEVMYNNNENRIHEGYLGKTIPLDTPTRSVKIKIKSGQTATFSEVSLTMGLEQIVLK